jgi:hypothetical protein
LFRIASQGVFLRQLLEQAFAHVGGSLLLFELLACAVRQVTLTLDF